MATPKLNLPELANAAANQTLANQSFDRLDQLVQMRVLDKDLAAPPAGPVDGAAYIVAATATGAWTGKEGQIAYWRSAANAWSFLAPENGWQTWVDDEGVFYNRAEGQWTVLETGGGGSDSTVTAVASSAGILDLSAITGDTVTCTLTENIASITYPAGVAGERRDLMIRFLQDAAGGWTVDLSGITWDGDGIAPTVAATAGKVTYITAVNVAAIGWEGFK